MISREQLKVGEIYEHGIVKKISRVLFIGDELLVTCDNDEQENHYIIDVFLAHWSIILKPKQPKKIVWYQYKRGDAVSAIEGSEECLSLDKSESYKRIKVEPELFVMEE